MNFTMLKATCWQYREVVDNALYRICISTCCCKLQACMLFVHSHMTHAGLWHIAVYLFFDQCDDWRTVKPWTSRCWRRLADNIGRLWIIRCSECLSIHVYANCKPACCLCIQTFHFRCLVEMTLQRHGHIAVKCGTWHMQACGISQFIFSFTNVMTEELSNHELHDVEGDLLTISGGCGSSAVANVSQYMFTPIASLHAVCAFKRFTLDVL